MGRNKDSLEAISKRLELGKEEIKRMNEVTIFSHKIVNDDVTNSYEIFKIAILALYPQIIKEGEVDVDSIKLVK
jgi:guanylate kinase